MNDFVIHHYGDVSVVVSLTRIGDSWMHDELNKLPDRGEPRVVKFTGSYAFISKSKIESFMDLIIQNGFSYRETWGSGAPYDKEDLT